MMMSIFLMLAAAAQNPEPGCTNPQTQIEMNMCAGHDYDRADAALNAQWKLTAAKMKDHDRSAYKPDDKRPGYFDTLLAAQRAWLTYRDRHCESEGYAARGGSMEPMLISGCKAALTQQRTAQLKALVEEY